MRAVRFVGGGNLRLEELPEPRPAGGHVLLRPLAVGVCGTDTHIIHGEFPSACPLTLGHEIGAVVAAAGAGVKRVREGDLVTVEPHVYCTSCRYCVMGQEHLCLEKKAFGVHLDGGLAEALVVPERTVYVLPPGMDARIGCLAEPLACCVHGMDRLALRSGTTVLVIGAGPVGLMLIRLARLAGAGLIVASEPNEQRRKGALEFGADAATDPSDEGWREQVMKLTGGFGFDSVIDAVGAAPTFEAAVDVAARGGRILVFGVAPMKTVAHLRPYDVFVRELTIIGSVINPYTHGRAVSLLPQMGLDKLDIKAFPLAAFREAFEAQATGTAAMKIQLLPQE
ncbi:MAG: alcohol dehydrogenase catalytic domain-containing protein [Acidobacteria bacterium]|nr:alcohol dehydrogenase catalytic domain-containing protein [Acidobacteriota bacterium]